MSNLQDITHLHSHAFHFGYIGRSESAPAVLATSSATGAHQRTRTDSKKGNRNQYVNNPSTQWQNTVSNIHNVKPSLPRFLSAFAIGTGNNWSDSYEAMGH